MERNHERNCECRQECGTNFREAVCIHTDKVYDSCRDKDCLENIRVYLTACAQEVVDRAINVKCTKAEIIWVFSDIEPVPFNRGFYSVDLKYFFKITLAVFTGAGRPTTVEGLATFDKKVILFGSEGNAKMFESKYKEDAFDAQLWKKTNMPHAVVDAIDRKRNKNAYISRQIAVASVTKQINKQLDFIDSEPEKVIFSPLGNQLVMKTNTNGDNAESGGKLGYTLFTHVRFDTNSYTSRYVYKKYMD